MHGNLDTAQPNHGATSAGLALWFGVPAAQNHFDPAALSAPDRARFAEQRHSRRQQEFRVSRALKVVAAADAAAAYSLSHSAGHAALLTTSLALRVGVDLEVAKERDLARIARFAFSVAEAELVESASSSEVRAEIFYTLWTLKEALAKALGLALADALRDCAFEQTGHGWAGSAPTDSDWSARVYQPRGGFFLATACVGATAHSPLQTWEWPPLQAAQWPLIACVTARAGAAVPPA